MTNSSYDATGCLACERCAHLLLQYEALKAQQTRVRYELEQVKHLPDSASARQLKAEADEISTRRMEAREIYAQHWAAHRIVKNTMLPVFGPLVVTQHQPAAHASSF
jgi:hypothetical protein